MGGGGLALVLYGLCGKGVPAGAIGDEIKFLSARRIGDRFKSRPARISDRPWREALDNVGIVGRVLLDLAFEDGPAERALAAYEPIDDGGVRLQFHALLEAIDENGGDPGSCIGAAR